jgi:hypothetical protein
MAAIAVHDPEPAARGDAVDPRHALVEHQFEAHHLLMEARRGGEILLVEEGDCVIGGHGGLL